MAAADGRGPGAALALVSRVQRCVVLLVFAACRIAEFGFRSNALESRALSAPSQANRLTPAPKRLSARLRCKLRRRTRIGA